MEPYTTTMTLIVPESIKPVAARIAKAFDPDVAGERSFDILKATKGSEQYAVSHSPCIERLASNAAYMLADPEVLFATVSEDYATRWQELVAPTLDECTQFANAAICYVGMGLDEAIDAAGLQRVSQETTEV